MSLESRLRELEEEAERVREQLKQQEAEVQGARPDKKDQPAEGSAGSPVAEEHKEPAVADSPEEPAIPPLSPEVQAEAESILRQAQVAKMRGLARPAMDLLMQAEKLAPNFPPVLETLGDELAAKSRWKDAQALYGRACKLDKTNVALERKYAQAVLKASIPVEALLMGLDSPGSMLEQTANAKLATVWSVILPGLGQIVLGETGKGVGLLVGWITSCSVALLIPNGIKGLISVVGNGKDSPNMIVLVPLLVAFIIWISAVTDAYSHAKTAKKHTVDRPTPPVNLPFE